MFTIIYFPVECIPINLQFYNPAHNIIEPEQQQNYDDLFAEIEYIKKKMS